MKNTSTRLLTPAGTDTTLEQDELGKGDFPTHEELISISNWIDNLLLNDYVKKSISDAVLPA